MAKSFKRRLPPCCCSPRRGSSPRRDYHAIPSNTELAFAAGITPVGVSSHSDYPRKPPVSNRLPAGRDEHWNALSRCKPDLVLAWRGGNAERQVNQLSALGIKVLWVNTATIEEIIATLRRTAGAVESGSRKRLAHPQ